MDNKNILKKLATEKAETEKEKNVCSKLYQKMRRQIPLKKIDAAKVS